MNPDNPSFRTDEQSNLIKQLLAAVEQSDRIILDQRKQILDLVLENDRLKAGINERTKDCDLAEPTIGDLVIALEFYADPFKIMDHISGSYRIEDTHYIKARDALAIYRGYHG